jgi:hypothetical protein
MALETRLAGFFSDGPVWCQPLQTLRGELQIIAQEPRFSSGSARLAFPSNTADQSGAACLPSHVREPQANQRTRLIHRPLAGHRSTDRQNQVFSFNFYDQVMSDRLSITPAQWRHGHSACMVRSRGNSLFAGPPKLAASCLVWQSVMCRPGKRLIPSRKNSCCVRPLRPPDDVSPDNHHWERVISGYVGPWFRSSDCHAAQNAALASSYEASRPIARRPGGIASGKMCHIQSL